MESFIWSRHCTMSNYCLSSVSVMHLLCMWWNKALSLLVRMVFWQQTSDLLLPERMITEFSDGYVRMQVGLRKLQLNITQMQSYDETHWFRWRLRVNKKRKSMIQTIHNLVRNLMSFTFTWICVSFSFIPFISYVLSCRDIESRFHIKTFFCYVNGSPLLRFSLFFSL